MVEKIVENKYIIPSKIFKIEKIYSEGFYADLVIDKSSKT
jgi:hypothetical protein